MHQEHVLMKIKVLAIALLSLSSFYSIAYPNWAITPPEDDSRWFYTLGSGVTNAEAQKNALGELANRIRVNVESTTQQFVSSSRVNNADSEQAFYLELDTKLSSDLLAFNRVEHVRHYYDDNNQRHYVLSKVDKASFFQPRSEKLQHNLDRYRFNQDSSDNEKLEKLLNFTWHKAQLTADLYLLEAYQQPTEALKQEYAVINAQFAELAGNTFVKVISPSKQLKLELSDWLKTKGFVLSADANKLSLTLLASDINQWTGHDNFYHAIKQGFDLAFIYNNQLIAEKAYSDVTYAVTNEGAEQQSWRKLKAQLYRD